MKKPALPKSQIQEVLYALITRINISRRQAVLSYGILNLPHQIHVLRKRYGIDVISESVVVKNKFGRDVKFCRYSISDKIKARNIYNKIQLEN